MSEHSSDLRARIPPPPKRYLGTEIDFMTKRPADGDYNSRLRTEHLREFSLASQKTRRFWLMIFV